MARENFCLREHIVKFILEQGFTPTSAFMMYSYFLLDAIERKSLIRANNELLLRSDELWVFGLVSDGVAEEIKLAKVANMPIHYFSVSNKPNCSSILVKCLNLNHHEDEDKVIDEILNNNEIKNGDILIPNTFIELSSESKNKNKPIFLDYAV